MPAKLPDAERKRRVNARVRKRKERVALPKFTLPRAVGRPVLYDGPAHCARAKRLALLGLTDTEIAFQFGINQTTLYAWAATYPEFSNSLDSGKTEADGFVAESHYTRAVGFERQAVKIFMPPGSIDENGKPVPVYAPYMEYYPGDVGAQKNWLNNRQRGRWQDRQSVDTSGTLDVRIANMTPEERAADAVALVQRIQARLAATRAIEGTVDSVTDAEETEE